MGGSPLPILGFSPRGRLCITLRKASTYSLGLLRLPDFAYPSKDLVKLWGSLMNWTLLFAFFLLSFLVLSAFLSFFGDPEGCLWSPLFLLSPHHCLFCISHSGLWISLSCLFDCFVALVLPFLSVAPNHSFPRLYVISVTELTFRSAVPASVTSRTLSNSSLKLAHSFMLDTFSQLILSFMGLVYGAQL